MCRTSSSYGVLRLATSFLLILALLAAPKILSIWNAVSSCGGGTAFVFHGGANAWATFFIMMGGTVPGACMACPAGKYRADPSLWCEMCPEKTVSDEGSTSCRRPGTNTCPKGLFDSGLRQGCVHCSAGHFKKAGAGLCSLCPIDTWSRAGSSKCQQCGRGEVASPGSHECTLCPAGTFAKEGSCRACSEGSSSEEGSISCACTKGWTREKSGMPQAGSCVRCPANTFKAVGGSAPCVPCPFGLATMQEGSDDVMQCLPADVISAVSSGWTMLLKSSGVLAEEPHERRWRQKATSEVSDYLSTMADKTVATTRTSVQSAGEALSWLLGQLQACIADLFDKMQDFYKQRCAEWKRASSPDVCTSERSQKRWLISQEDYNYWRQAASRVRVRPSPEGCRQMKSAARRVLLLVHPDKFLALHPSCKGHASSEVLARNFNSEYQFLKESCSHL